MDQLAEQLRNAAIQAYAEHFGLGDIADISVESMTLVTQDGQTFQGDITDISIGPMTVTTPGDHTFEEAIQIARQASELTPSDHPDRVECLRRLVAMLGEQYYQTGEMGDLGEAISVSREVVELTPNGHPHRAGWLTILGILLRSQYERTGEMADLEEAMMVARHAVELTPHDHLNRPDRLESAGKSLTRQYQRTGKMVDLEEAIEVSRRTVESIPHDHPMWASMLETLGIQLSLRYERTERRADLEEAIGLARQAVELMSHGHSNRAGRFMHLGVMLGSRYERTGEMTDLEEAIVTARQAVKLTPQNPLSRGGYSINLGTLLMKRYDRTGDQADLEEAIGLTRQAVGSAQLSDPDRSGCLATLGRQLHMRYELTSERTDLEEAIKVARQAVDLAPHDHPQRALCLGYLGSMLQMRCKRTGKATDLEEASSCFYDAWQCQTALPSHRIQVAAQCLKLLAAQAVHAALAKRDARTKINTAIQLGQAVINLIPSVNTKLLDRSDQQFVMATFAGVAADVCAFLLASGLPADALEYLEKGRASIIGQLVNGRSELSSLQQDHADLARRYELLRDEVNMPVRRLEQDAGRTKGMVRRQEAMAELDTCILEIRGVMGYERFLLGQTVAEMQECAAGGTIAVVNITKLRSDAILVSQAAIRTINLPRLIASDTEAWLGKKWTGTEVRRQERPQKNKEYLEYLAWLWDVCVRPVVDDVYSVGEVRDGLPRIWWIGSGLASSMPFHAAGVHSPSSTDNTFSRAISSYTPSIKALGYAQHRARATDRTRGSLLIATMPTTPAQAMQADARKPPDLPGVTEEGMEITHMAAGYMPIQRLDLPNVEQVVDQLQNCSIAHFACHGSTDYADPSNSGLILQKRGGQGLEQDRLTVRRVSELNLAHARIAYLSACSTAENKAERLLDEVIHVVSGFQVAGFPHVVGCLWPSVDRVCVEVASRFYRSLLQRRMGTGWDGRDIASAIQNAAMAVREAEMNMPLMWAQFVHFGA